MSWRNKRGRMGRWVRMKKLRSPWNPRWKMACEGHGWRKRGGHRWMPDAEWKMRISTSRAQRALRSTHGPKRCHGKETVITFSLSRTRPLLHCLTRNVENLQLLLFPIPTFQKPPKRPLQIYSRRPVPNLDRRTNAALVPANVSITEKTLNPPVLDKSAASDPNSRILGNQIKHPCK